MRVSIYFLISLFFFSLNQLQAQDVEVKMKKYPATESYSLGGRGLLVYGEDPTKNSNQKEIVLIKEGQVEWYSQFMPSNYNVIPVFSNESNYVYFVEEGYVKGGNLGYVFIDNSGTSRKGKINISLEMRKVGVKDASKLELEKMYSAKSYFVLLFNEKSGSEFSYYALFVAHGSQKMYAMKLVQSSYEAKDKFKSPFEFIGTSREKILLAQRAVEGDFSGFYISEIDPKANKDETRKFAFPIGDMTISQNIRVKGVYDINAKPISAGTTIKSRENQGGILLRKDHIYMYGLNIEKDVKRMEFKKVDINANEKWSVKFTFDPDDLEHERLISKIKAGNFGMQIEKIKEHLIGAVSGKSTMLFYIDDENGSFSHKDFETYDLDKLNKNIYYIFENLRKKSFTWFKFCGLNFYTSESSFNNKMEFKVTWHKL